MTRSPSTVPWTGIEPLELGATYLLEASAGTGKTWQIEALVVRLVAEYGIAIDRILVITFTKAATGELRERIRRRLALARDALGEKAPPSPDPIIAHLCVDTEQRDERQLRLSRALATFDLAPISTIHAFSQRMLEQFAFESGLEPGLELLPDVTPVLHELIADELARVYDDATAQEITLLEDMGWHRAGLEKLALAMIKAVAPQVMPQPLIEHATPCEHARHWLKQSQELSTWLHAAEGQACIAALRAELPGPSKQKSKKGAASRRLDGHFMRNKDGLQGAIAALREWLRDGAPRGNRMDGGELVTWCRNLTVDHLRAKWKGSSADLETFGATPLFERVSALLKLQDELWPQACVAFAVQIRERVHAELARRGVLTYDTMLSQLAERIEAQAAQGSLATAIRQRFDVALVDEFQDTDAAQWPVLKAVFANPDRRLLVIGDPKQAIYGFRGADVRVYLDAAAVARQPRATMTCNRRSDVGVVHAMNHLFGAGSGVFDLDGIDYVKVDAQHSDARIRGLAAIEGRDRCPFELRWFDATTLDENASESDRSVLNKGASNELTPRLCANEIARLLSGGAELLDDRDKHRPPLWRAVTPGDIAVLVRGHSQGERMHRQLSALGIPAVSAARGSVLQSAVVEWLCAFLTALAQPGRVSPARALAVTPLFGWSGEALVHALERVDAADAEAGMPVDPRWDAWMSDVTDWAKRYARHGFIRVFEAALDRHDVLPRLLTLPDGERYATDMRHLAELCHAEERRARLGPAALASWLRSSMAHASGDADAEALRLESDARAVQILTIHASKGLEFPIVMLPFAWDAKEAKDSGDPILWHPPDAVGGSTSLSLHPKGSLERNVAFDTAKKEAAQEDLRLLYVALTRARHHSVAWLGSVQEGNSAKSPKLVISALLRVLSRSRDDSGRLGAADTDSATAWDRLSLLARTSEGSIGVALERSGKPMEAPRLAAESHDELRPLPWSGRASLTSPFQVASYSSLVAAHAPQGDEPRRPDEALTLSLAEATQDVDRDDDADTVEPAVDRLIEDRSTAALSKPAPLATMHGGTEVGTWVHDVLEHLDFARGTSIDGTDAALLAAQLGERHGIRNAAQHALLTAALPAFLDTPLDGARTQLPDGFCLRQLARRDRIDELGFDLRLGAGTRHRHVHADGVGLINEAAARVALQARLADEPEWPGASWLRGFLSRGELLPPIAGILTGFIDLVLRVGDDARNARYYVADYKTNRIVAPHAGRDSRLLHYTQPWLHWEMERHSYPLQALLYTVALHRLLEQRLGAAYDYDRHIGGHLYLFLRGMQGGQCDRDGGLALGVLHDRWPKHVVLGLDSALRGDVP